MTSHKDKLTAAWTRRWESCEEEEKLTILGKAMFKAKRKALKKLVSELDVSTVLEAGCGLGETMEVYRDAGITVSGVDISEDAVALCKRKGFDVRHVSIEDLTETYEMVSSDGMLEHFLNFEPMAKEFMRLADKYVLIIQPNYNSKTGQTLAWLANMLRGSVNVYEYNYRLEDFQNIFEGNGFKQFKSVPVFADVFRILVYRRQ